MKRRSGFTLVELLIVLAVIAALLATLTPVAVNAVRNANATRVASDLRNVREAMSSYFYVEKPTNPESITQADVGAYIQGNVDQVEASIVRVGTTDEYTITVRYTGVVSNTDLQRVWAEVATDSSITSSVVRYW